MSTDKFTVESEASPPKQDSPPVLPAESTGRDAAGRQACIRPTGTDEVVCGDVVETPPEKRSDGK